MHALPTGRHKTPNTCKDSTLPAIVNLNPFEELLAGILSQHSTQIPPPELTSLKQDIRLASRDERVSGPGALPAAAERPW